MDSLYQKSVKPRPRFEWTSKFIYRPLAHLIVVPLSKTRVTPEMVVMFHTVLGLHAVSLIPQGQTWWPALLMQVKSVLDGADGQLARATGQTSETGRYLDTNMDFVVNTALFVAIGAQSGEWFQAFLGWVLLALIGTTDFQWEAAHQRSRGNTFRAAPEQKGDNPVILGLMRGFYNVVFGPQDRLIRAWNDGRFKAITRKARPDQLKDAELIYHTPRLLDFSMNMGLATQFLVAGVFIALGQPLWYVYALYVQAALLLLLQVYRERITLQFLKNS
ncbi:CDP-alcohol phosphatidyltransferase family protein [Deinococcus cellulosilyticus]|uniref:CDP-alcohol phosphatidyltransferase n=1 Tax=Deinococcus cellulosilyticus (strain DSM 18568 / NBRC 106333 / KACC 11606 / 5516J-15) TaxID=1223518 RepID=A0A511N886_DEIC1|nr:CDP-alcohol phosphatidyltransferase family protein [Deinococcus cellulosilyticus]GEM49052.1 CDP-alcohol phosphatidyltransferase [Deinococcus cellulosilyticus NBRC 106333 = KACC 11606]